LIEFFTSENIQLKEKYLGQAMSMGKMSLHTPVTGWAAEIY